MSTLAQGHSKLLCIVPKTLTKTKQREKETTKRQRCSDFHRCRTTLFIPFFEVNSHKTPKTRALKKNTVPHTSLGVPVVTHHFTCVGPSTPAEVLSSSESAKARAAAQANNELHLRSHAACARPRSSSGSSRTLSEARPVRNCADSAENRPPTSPARTTSWALPRSPTNSR